MDPVLLPMKGPFPLLLISTVLHLFRKSNKHYLVFISSMLKIILYPSVALKVIFHYWIYLCSMKRRISIFQYLYIPFQQVLPYSYYSRKTYGIRMVIYKIPFNNLLIFSLYNFYRYIFFSRKLNMSIIPITTIIGIIL